ncbi:MAG: class I SAM-dependent methyltransferase family protein [Candidatus Bathyarchaeia archaeon]
MPKEAVCLKIPKAEGEKAIILVSKLKIIDRELEIQRNKNFIYVPLTSQPSEDALKTLQSQIQEYEITTCAFQEKARKSRTIIEYLEGKLSPHLLASLPKAMDIVGDIAIIEVPPELEKHKGLIGEAIIETHRNIKTVLAKAGAISGTYRLRELAVIAGEPKTATVHREYGCQYYVDLAKAYFSPRLSYEHHRIASQVKEGETVIDMFAGVGPFSILIAKMRERVKVYAIDINPEAVELLKRNIRLNRVEGKVYPMLGDAEGIIEKMFVEVADRVIMNLPEKAIDFVVSACRALKAAGGMIHFYSFVKPSEPLEDIKIRFARVVEKSGRKLEKIHFSRLVRETAPYEWQAVIDAEIR